MRIERIRELLCAVPFRPMRVFLSSGSNYLVPHPDFVYFGRDHVVITVPPSAAGARGLAVTCALLHVTHVEVEDEKA
jgi:hypothetical protein